MDIETQQRMIGAIRNSFDINLTTVSELLHCERRNVADVFYKGKGGGLNTDKLIWLLYQAKRFAEMNYTRPDSMFNRVFIDYRSVRESMTKMFELPQQQLDLLKSIDTLEAGTRARGQGKTLSKPFRSAGEAADEISTPYFGESYNYG